MVAQSTIHFHFVGCRGECRAGLGACKKGNGNTDVEILQKLVMRMMTNKPNNNGVAAASPMRTLVRTSSKHVFLKRQKNEGSRNRHTSTVMLRDSLYIPHPCSECHTKTRSYCKCDPGCPRCMACFGVHAHKHGSWNSTNIGIIWSSQFWVFFRVSHLYLWQYPIF